MGGEVTLLRVVLMVDEENDFSYQLRDGSRRS